MVLPNEILSLEPIEGFFRVFRMGRIWISQRERGRCSKSENSTSEVVKAEMSWSASLSFSFSLKSSSSSPLIWAEYLLCARHYAECFTKLGVIVSTLKRS